MFKQFLKLGLFGLLPLQFAIAGISVTPLVIKHKSTNTQSYVDIKVKNEGDKSAYVEVIAKKFDTNIGKFTPFDGSIDPKKFGMIVSPPKLVIPAKQTRIVRANLLNKDVTTEEAYTLTISPVVNDIKGFTGVDDKDTVSGVQVVVSYKVQLFNQPKEIHKALDYQYKDGLLTVKNTGNSYSVLRNMYACDKDFKTYDLLPQNNQDKQSKSKTDDKLASSSEIKGCKALGSEVVYAGEEKTFTVDQGKQIVFYENKSSKLHKYL
ncbi:hypothetical protein [Cysteiniphilum sp. 6C5]|uniref:hypothetical protein n=1 Tax=unclassified Cysteiniphilum TaxID=2610889 RepID=UPI003F839D9B